MDEADINDKIKQGKRRRIPTLKKPPGSMSIRKPSSTAREFALRPGRVCPGDAAFSAARIVGALIQPAVGAAFFEPDDYPNRQGYLMDLYQQPGSAETVDFDHIKRHYEMTDTEINPTRIVPLGSIVDLTRRQGREKMS
jgi:hypothetical protein